MRKTSSGSHPIEQSTCAPAWQGEHELRCGFLGRAGGVSRGAFGELNLSYRVGDETGDVATNWQRVADSLGDASFVRIRQVHGDTVVLADAVRDQEPEADALITGAPGLLLAILTADCVPLLMVDRRTGAVAAVHAGWRGTVAGIVPNVIEQLRLAFGTQPADLRVALGPAIGGCCYEVSPQIVEELQARWGTLADAVRQRPGAPRPHLDLRAANSDLLRRHGVSDISIVGPCTRCAHTRYFSHRHATRPGGEGTTGRQLSFIGRRLS